MLALKRKGNRYYREDRFSFRSFPIKRVEPEKLIAEGKAELVDFFIWEIGEYNEAQEAPVIPDNVVSIEAKRQQKQESIGIEEARQRFINEIMPNISNESLLRLAETAASGDKNLYKIELMKVFMESAANQVK
jgi:hypothetical protein